MQPNEEFAINQAEGALGLLDGEERKDAEELIQFARRLFPVGEASLEETARIGRLVELLARRRAAAMPYAALGRALLAHLRSAKKDKNDLIKEFESKMAMMGM